MTFWRIILDFVFPNSCLGCNKSGTDLCEKCLGDLPTADIPEHDFISAIFSYRDKVVKDAIWQLKYRGKKDLASALAGPVYERIIEELPDLEIFHNFTEPVIMPIPLATGRLKERGYNQAGLIANHVAHLGHWPLIDMALEKIIETTPQARVRDRKERLKNLKNCFLVKNPELIRGKNIILIDDVATTGATLLEAKKILTKSGAKKIFAFTVAH